MHRNLEKINDIPIGTRLICGFILVVILMSSIGLIGFFGMNAIGNEMDKVYSDGTVPLYEVTSIETSLNSIRALVFRTFSVPAERPQDLERMQTEIQTIDNLISKLKQESLSPEQQANLTLFETQWADYKSAAKNVFSLLEDGKTNDALTSIANGGQHANTRRATADTFASLKQGILVDSKNIAEAGHAEKDRIIPLMVGTGIIVAIIALAIAVFLTKGITNPLHQVINQFKLMKTGDIGARLRLSRKDEIGEMATMFDQFSDYLEHNVVETMHRIAAGDLTSSITSQGETDQISPALSNTLTSLTTVINELQKISSKAAAGDLSARGTPGKLQGSYQEIILGFNSTLDILISPVNEAITLSRQYADCDFTARFNPKIRIEGDFKDFRDALDRIGTEVSSALKVVEQQMTDLMDHSGKATSGIEDVRRGAGIIAGNAEQTEHNAEQSKEGIAQVLRAMEDLTSTITSVSTNVEAVAQSASEADRQAKTGILSTATTEEGMKSIKHSSSEAEALVKEIGDQMTEITKIIDIITDISEQTNLLALNAAIEAARAGDAGLGFAVVAGEVKELANQTGNSAQKIAAMISTLEKKSTMAVKAMEGAGEAIEYGENALKETVQAFNQLTISVEDISKNMTSVAGATEEQAASFEEITASITEMNSLVSETAKDAMNSSATAEEALSVVEMITSIITDINDSVATTTDEMKKFKVTL
ncbi:HAMP domain-containing methyl-accepting chemotaxis protein [Methanospirillum lacunae]|uniref:Methyl-accepting chemotaxis protein n=1 Tax=Methanospirillum lacunae TaxID=668570 RepID=A0A2V2MT62_9EURY|nr:methyl-accepting chemotaxis protein [Methanospirillum lacunae]PWR71384.1 hypothetical protein DK846_10990 [Methanospirillum lacunae]